jgi:hypothetical protein
MARSYPRIPKNRLNASPRTVLMDSSSPGDAAKARLGFMLGVALHSGAIAWAGVIFSHYAPLAPEYARPQGWTVLTMTFLTFASYFLFLHKKVRQENLTSAADRSCGGSDAAERATDGTRSSVLLLQGAGKLLRGREDVGGLLAQHVHHVVVQHRPQLRQRLQARAKPDFRRVLCSIKFLCLVILRLRLFFHSRLWKPLRRRRRAR